MSPRYLGFYPFTRTSGGKTRLRVPALLRRAIRLFSRWRRVRRLLTALMAAVVIALVGSLVIFTVVITGYQMGKQAQARTDGTCPYIATRTVNNDMGGDGVTAGFIALYRAGTCNIDTTNGSVVVIDATADPQGMLFKRSLRAVPSPVYRLIGSIRATNGLKTYSLLFDYHHMLFSVTGYGGSVTLPMVQQVARDLVTTRG